MEKIKRMTMRTKRQMHWEERYYNLAEKYGKFSSVFFEGLYRGARNQKNIQLDDRKAQRVADKGWKRGQRELYKVKEYLKTA